MKADYVKTVKEWIDSKVSDSSTLAIQYIAESILTRPSVAFTDLIRQKDRIAIIRIRLGLFFGPSSEAS